MLCAILRLIASLATAHTVVHIFLAGMPLWFCSGYKCVVLNVSAISYLLLVGTLESSKSLFD